MVLLISLSSLFFLRTLASPNALNGSVYALLSALAIYSHLFASLVILAQLLSLVVLRQRRHPWPTLLRSIAGEPVPERTPLLPVELIVRDSCGGRKIPTTKERH